MAVVRGRNVNSSENLWGRRRCVLADRCQDARSCVVFMSLLNSEHFVRMLMDMSPVLKKDGQIDNKGRENSGFSRFGQQQGCIYAHVNAGHSKIINNYRNSKKIQGNSKQGSLRVIHHNSTNSAFLRCAYFQIKNRPNWSTLRDLTAVLTLMCRVRINDEHNLSHFNNIS